MAAAVAAGVRGDSPLLLEIAFLAVPAVGGYGSMLAAGVVAIVALRRGERSLVLVIPILLGAFALMFAVGEIAFPH